METPRQKQEKQEDLVGSGIFGTVVRETHSQNDKSSSRVAKKTINLKKLNNKINQQIEEEIKKKVKNKIIEMSNIVEKNLEKCNITKYYDDITDNNGKLSFKMELCNFNLGQYVNENCPKEGQGLDIGTIYDILVQLNNAFRIIEYRNIKLGNIKLENILVNLEQKKYIFKLSGFEIVPELINIARMYRPDMICQYLPPEILKADSKNIFRIDQKTDTWSLGIVIYYLFFKEFPYEGKTCESVLEQIYNKKRKKTNFTELDNLIDGLLNENKEQRFTWFEYLVHSFFKKNGFWKEYIIGDKIGKGQFSTVYKAKSKTNQKSAAIKIIDFSKIKKIENHQMELNEIIKELINRIETMKKLFKDNPDYFVEIYNEFEVENGIAIAMELCKYNLKKYISRYSDPKANDIFFFLVDVNKSFKILRNKNILLGNLKLENILIKEQKNANDNIFKLTDIGLCSHLLSLTKSSSKISDNICYISPELLEGDANYTQTCDLWSLGIIIYYFRFKNFPYDYNSDIKMINQIKNSIGSSLKKSENEKLNSLIGGLLEKEPTKRLEWDTYFHHQFFINREYTQYYELLGEPLARQTCYVVYKAKEKKTNIEKVIKIINKEEIRRQYLMKTGKNIKESEIKKFVNHLIGGTKVMKMLEGNNENKNTVQFFEYFNTKTEFCIVMEKCDTDLSHTFARRKNNFSLEEIKDLLVQLNNTFRIMAKNKIIHGDLKLENILSKTENDKLIYKLTDYGVSKEFLEMSETIMGWGGSPYYSAPEILSGNDFDESSDLWSLGIILYILYFRERPYNGDDADEILKDINSKGQRNLNLLSDDPQFDNLIRRLLTVDVKERITWEGYFMHPFLDKGNCWKFYEGKEFLAMGAYYTTYKVKSIQTKEYKAIKVIDLNVIRSLFERKNFRPCTKKDLKTYIDDFIAEIESMQLRRGPNKDNINTLLFEQFFQTDDEFCMVLELCDGDLLQLKEEKGKFTAKEIYQIFSQLNNTYRIIQMYNQKIRDLRLEEILYNVNEKGEYTYKIKNFEEGKKVLTLLKGGGAMSYDGYKAPEILNNDIKKSKLSPEKIEKLYQKAYLWNIGIIMFSLYFGYFPYEGDRPNEILSNIRKNEQSQLNEIYDLELKDLIKNLLKYNSEERIDWDGYFNHKFFSEEKWK